MANLLENVHSGLHFPEFGEKVRLIRGMYKYYHYLCDGFDDRVGYNLITLFLLIFALSPSFKGSVDQWASCLNDTEVKGVPTIPEIQECLVTIGDKPPSFINSKDWIGSIEVSMCINQLYNVCSKIIHVPSGSELFNHVQTIESHFENFGSPIMMGGDQDASSKGILGICVASTTYLLVLDPHFVGKSSSREELQERGWIKWKKLDEFLDFSFYNMCLPQQKALGES
ncbi:inactive Ufm1-specific protease 1-like [Centruroides sculpturatus]|uniref:inactive Ufm1-specific protease 1-like n=1 Tax=Centruroides sculpturatus TaxID=218467 RepID=UPI000C6E9FC9|nr:inactive Ufm1-specific protease 1-like [Centruroides sculpturatus]